ncbi:MAG: FtsX-like permease family protein [Wenzhouxiangellaceae bacterium]|nr:MAG: FtsX-like permease family protein [Wenzhouxiangellaceae bacterium]
MNQRRSLRMIPALALANLRHEWILTLCLVIALAAVIAPLLVLLGLRHGTIETLREQLVQDPVYRELRPLQTREFAPEWFKDVARWPEVEFLTPTILPLSSVVQIVHPENGRVEIFDLVPTADGDPLLLENRGVIPADDEIVLTAESARRLEVGTGDELTVRVTRTRGGRTELAESTVQVGAVLEPRASSLARVYATLDFVLDVEAYKEGYGAVQRGWSGATPEPFLSFDGMVLLLAEPMPPIERTGLIINTGFARIEPLDASDVQRILGLSLPQTFHAYHLYSPGATVTPASLRAVDQKLRGRDRIVLPWAAVEVRADPDAGRIQLIGLSLDEHQADKIGLPILPWGALRDRADDGKRLRSVLLPEQDQTDIGSLTVEGVETLSFTLNPVGKTALNRPVVPVELIGVLRTAAQRAVLFDDQSQQFRMARGGYRGFRMYAASIDDVPPLYERLRALGIEVQAEVETISRIQVLDAGLSRLFWLIATLGIGGGTAVLIASLYAAVERRRKDLGMLRLIGLARSSVFFFPIVQGASIAGLGLLAGFAGYAGLATAINRTFADDLQAGQRFCALPGGQVPFIILVTLALAGAASLVAAWCTTRIDPAEVIRDQ